MLGRVRVGITSRTVASGKNPPFGRYLAGFGRDSGENGDLGVENGDFTVVIAIWAENGPKTAE